MCIYIYVFCIVYMHACKIDPAASTHFGMDGWESNDGTDQRDSLRDQTACSMQSCSCLFCRRNSALEFHTFGSSPGSATCTIEACMKPDPGAGTEAVGFGLGMVCAAAAWAMCTCLRQDQQMEGALWFEGFRMLSLGSQPTPGVKTCEAPMSSSFPSAKTMHTYCRSKLADFG